MEFRRGRGRRGVQRMTFSARENDYGSNVGYSDSTDNQDSHSEDPSKESDQNSSDIQRLNNRIIELEKIIEGIILKQSVLEKDFENQKISFNKYLEKYEKLEDKKDILNSEKDAKELILKYKSIHYKKEEVVKSRLFSRELDASDFVPPSHEENLLGSKYREETINILKECLVNKNSGLVADNISFSPLPILGISNDVRKIQDEYIAAMGLVDNNPRFFDITMRSSKINSPGFVNNSDNPEFVSEQANLNYHKSWNIDQSFYKFGNDRRRWLQYGLIERVRFYKNAERKRIFLFFNYDLENIYKRLVSNNLFVDVYDILSASDFRELDKGNFHKVNESLLNYCSKVKEQKIILTNDIRIVYPDFEKGDDFKKYENVLRIKCYFKEYENKVFRHINDVEKQHDHLKVQMYHNYGYHSHAIGFDSMLMGFLRNHFSSNDFNFNELFNCSHSIGYDFIKIVDSDNDSF